MIQFSSNYYASNEDLKMIEKFYEVRMICAGGVVTHKMQDKDTSKYNLALGNALDSIRSRIAYVSVSVKYVVDEQLFNLFQAFY
jgi:aminopeptidase 2